MYLIPSQWFQNMITTAINIDWYVFSNILASLLLSFYFIEVDLSFYKQVLVSGGAD